MLTYLKTYLIKLYFNIILLGDTNLPSGERSEYLWKSIATLAPFAILMQTIDMWFINNVLFGTGIILLIMINMIIGGSMHYRKKDFMWFKFISKTIMMVLVTFITYLVLEIVISILGNNPIVSGFRAVLQVATLLYPGSKILKNVFILSRGEHPPKWIMQKVYNFQKNGDLKAFMNDGRSESLLDSIELKSDEIIDDIQILKSQENEHETRLD
jgi:hypothetical protein